MVVEGDICIGEATRWAGKASARLTGYPRQIFIVNAAVLLTAVGCLLLYLMVAAIFDFPWGGGMAALVLGLVIGVPVSQRVCIAWSRGFARKAFAERGMTDPVAASYRAEDTAFIHTSGTVETRVPWASLSDIVAAGPYWVMLCVGVSPIYLPRRFFADPASEAAFLRSTLARMAPEAVVRSPEAAAIACL